MTGLAPQLQALGAEVRVCAPPDFAELLDSVDVPVSPVGWPIRALATGAVPGKAQAGLSGIAAELTAMACEAVAGVSEGCAAVWDLKAEHMNAMFGETINTHRTSIGLPPVDGIRDHVFTGHPFLAADPVLGPWQETPELDVAQTGAWIRLDERPLPADLEAFLAAGAKPVYVGFGSMLIRGANAQEVSRAVIEAVRTQGRRVLLGSGWAGLALIDDAGGCFVVGEVNQQALFRRVAAVVHHGGAGTTATAARAGAPQVIVPQVADQPYWAGRVTGLGIGTGHDGPTPTAESLSAALKIALAPETAARASTVAETARTDGAEQAAKLLLDMIGRSASAVSAG